MQFKPKKKKKPFDKWYLPHAMGNFNLMTKLLMSCNLSIWKQNMRLRLFCHTKSLMRALTTKSSLWYSHSNTWTLWHYKHHILVILFAITTSLLKAKFWSPLSLSNCIKCFKNCLISKYFVSMMSEEILFLLNTYSLFWNFIKFYQQQFSVSCQLLMGDI